MQSKKLFLQARYKKTIEDKKTATFFKRDSNKENFISNLNLIRKHNLQYERNRTSFKTGLNAYCHLSYKDVIQTRTGFVINNRSEIFYEFLCILIKFT